jgi:hypothetical protein
MATKTDNDQAYLPMLAAAAPVFALKSIIGDMPKASVEHAVEQTALHGSGNFGKYLAKGFRGKGAGRALGAGLGILTAPLFLRGTRLLESKKEDDRRKGYALVAGSTAALAGAKGFFENAGAALVQGRNPAVAATKGALLGTIRAGYKVPMALATAAGVAAGRSNSEDNPKLKYVLPVAMGVGAGAVSRMIEEAAETGISRNRKQLLSAVGLRKLRAAGLGGAAGGAIGGLVLAKAVDILSPKKEKHAGIAMEAVGSLGDILAAVNATAVGGNILHGYPTAIAQHIATGAGYGYKAQSGIVGKLLGGKGLTRWQQMHNKARARQVGLGIQEGLYGYSTAPFGDKMLANAGIGLGGVSPESMGYRELGIKLGRTLRDKTPAERVQHLQRMQKFMLDRPDSLKGPQGELNPLVGPLLGGISMAVGERPFYKASKNLPTLKRLGIKALRGGHPYTEGGLPTQLGVLEKDPSWLRANYPHLLSAGVGLASHGLVPLPASMLLGHLAFSGGKNIVTTTPAFKKLITKSLHSGVRYGAFPNAPFKPSYGAEFAASPAVSLMERSLKPIVKAIRDEEAAKLLGTTRGYVAQARDKIIAKKIDMSIPKAVAVPVGVGAVTGLLGVQALRDRQNNRR